MPNRTFPPDILTILVREAAGSPSFSDEPFCRRLSLESGPYGIRIVVLPLPDDNQAALPKQGFVYVDDQWRAVPLPATKLVMDRSLQPLPQTWRQQLSAPGPGARTTYWSASLPGKWKVHQILSRDSETKELLPQTALFQPHVRWETWLERWPQGLFFKPVSGTHGKNTFRLARGTEPSTWVIDGRNHSNEPFHWLFQTPERVSSRLHACSSRRRLLIQPYLDLSHHGRPFDIRALMQKDGRGRWLLTGCMVREGPEKTLTSNLHGGGKAYPALPYLQDRFGASEANALLEQIKQAAGRIPRCWKGTSADSPSWASISERTPMGACGCLKPTPNRAAPRLQKQMTRSYFEGSIPGRLPMPVICCSNMFSLTFTVQRKCRIHPA